MNQWMLLTDDQSIEWYGVPSEIAKSKANIFYGNKIPEEAMKWVWDVTRRFVALLATESQNLVAFRFHTVDPDSMDLMKDDYNPFEIPFGHYLDIDKETVIELAALLREYSSQMAYREKNEAISVEKVSEDLLASRGIEINRFSNETRHYILLSSEMSPDKSKKLETLICVSSDNLKDDLLLKAYNIPNNVTITPGNAEEMRTSTIILDRKALETLADIIIEYANNSANL